ncbi:bifunctional nuclease family protein [Terriglobus sp.]|uniref:bifunctional nuclease family protein n=1 Tax=Terriglobus sp. TaxID=1889013 RepID=UPI003AFF839F
MKTTRDTVPDEVEVRIRGLMMDPVTSMPMIVLKDIAGDAVLPIWVGIFEANAIALEIEKNTTPRPMTHDLIRNILRGFDTHVTRVVISDLREDTFYAVIWMERGGETLAIDARPSDALALAMRSDCPIFVARTVLDNAKATSATSQAGNSDELRRWLENLNDDDLGKYKM